MIQINPLPDITKITVPNTTAPSQKMAQLPSVQTTTETPAATTENKITAETTPQDAMRIAAAMRKEKQIRKMARDLESERQKIREENKQYEPYKNMAELAKKNKLEAIKAAGITYDELTTQMLNGGNLPPEDVATQRAEAIINAKLAELERKQQEIRQQEQQTNYQSAIKQIDAEVQAIASTSEKYLLVKELASYHDVTEYIEKEFHRTQLIIPIEAALEKVNKEILEGLQGILKNPNVRALLIPEEPKILAESPEPNQKITTLTHKATVSPSASRPLTASDRRQRAIRVAMGLSPDA